MSSRNALKHGARSAETIEQLSNIRSLIREARVAWAEHRVMMAEQLNGVIDG